MMGYGQGYGGGYNGGYDGMMGGGFGAFLFLLFGALFIAGIVLLVIWAVRASGGHGNASPGAAPPATSAAAHDAAVAIAKRRCASGEITTQEYAEIMRALGA